MKNVLDKLATDLLNIDIEVIHIHLAFLNRKREKLSSLLSESLPTAVLDKFRSLQELSFIDSSAKLNTSLCHKFNALDLKPAVRQALLSNVTPPDTVVPASLPRHLWFVNLTEDSIPDEIVDVVSLGSKYAPTSHLDQATIIDTIKNLEGLVSSQTFSDDQKRLLRGVLIDNVDHYSRTKAHVPAEDRLFAQKLAHVRNYLKNHTDTFFTLADKGNVTVALSRSTYCSKMSSLLADESTYRVVNPDPLADLQKTTQRILVRWNTSNFFNKVYHHNELTNTDTTLPLCYGLPKIHKADVPMRPIVSAIGSPTYFLSRFLSRLLLKSIPKPSSYIKHSWDLLDKVKLVNIPDDHILISLDVTSLFTNIPVDLVKHALSNRYAFIARHCTIPLSELTTVANFLMENTYFQFNNVYYKQIF